METGDALVMLALAAEHVEVTQVRLKQQQYILACIGMHRFLQQRQIRLQQQQKQQQLQQTLQLQQKQQQLQQTLQQQQKQQQQQHQQQQLQMQMQCVYLGGRKGIQCASCGTQKTSLWRKGRELGQGMHANLCNACGIKSSSTDKPKKRRLTR